MTAAGLGEGRRGAGTQSVAAVADGAAHIVDHVERRDLVPDDLLELAVADHLSSAAMRHAREGRLVLPLKPRGKVPITAHGVRDATTDTGTIVWWWRAHPAANVGIATGATSGIVVLDVDGPAGEASLGKLPNPLPDTLVVLTRRGAHFWFAHPGGKVANSAGKLGPGLDVRGDGGYVVAPPSRYGEGGAAGVYVWGGEGRTLARWPEWLRPPEDGPQRATESPRSILRGVVGRGNRYAQTALEAEAEAVRKAPVGTRNDQLNRSAYAVARFVRSGELRFADVVAVFLAAAAAAGLPEREARSTLASAFGGRLIR